MAMPELAESRRLSQKLLHSKGYTHKAPRKKREPNNPVADNPPAAVARLAVNRQFGEYLKQRGIPLRRHWKLEEIEFVRDTMHDDLYEVALVLDRTPEAVYSKRGLFRGQVQSK